MCNRTWLFVSCMLCLGFTSIAIRAQVTVVRLNPTAVEVRHADGSVMTLDFYGPTIVRMFQDPEGGIMRNPVAMPPAQILVPNPRTNVGTLKLEETNTAFNISTEKMLLHIDRNSGLITVFNAALGRQVTAMTGDLVTFDGRGHTTLTLTSQSGEQFYGGGVQNGRYAHGGKVIQIVNTNNWVDGGVASPSPFFWSTAGYGLMWHTFAPGRYDFGATEAGKTVMTHDVDYLDVFLMVNDGAVALLNDYYQLTGHPVLLPKFGFYEGHLNAYNRDYWKEVEEGGIAFEDGKQYKEAQQDNGGIRESLNGEELGAYQFSARAVIDRYEAADMPLGWLLPNDGYGTGYGQTGTLEGNVDNLRRFGDYARAHGVEIGLWTQSDLHPKEGVEALLQRDIVREVRDAGVRVLKTDVAWVGAGYSFGLNGVADVGEIMPYYGNDARPFIISLDGWAGTQRYAGIWTGDQTGGEWEYIRFHIPTYIGSGLSGQPNITSDMDGIFGGRNLPMNVRDFQWKTFTPMQLNMDGWGSNPKYPQALGEPATSINRWYLKLKSMLMPYAYSIAHEAIDGMPMIRPMFMYNGIGKEVTTSAFLNSTLMGYQFLYGNDILVAPIYKETRMDADGNDVRDFIYLPEGQWIDFFSGECYDGGKLINQYECPLWKLPVFVRRGAIIPMTHAHNNPNQIDKGNRGFYFYPLGQSEFTVYDDDGCTQAYLGGASATTRVTSSLINKKGKGLLTLTVEPTKGGYEGMTTRQTTELVVMLQQRPKSIQLKVNGKKVQLDEARTLQDFTDKTNVFYFDPQPELNLWSTPETPMAQVSVKHSPRLYVCVDAVDITTSTIEVVVDGYTFDSADHSLKSKGALDLPHFIDREADANVHPAYQLQAAWSEVENADYYELLHQGNIYSRLGTQFVLEDLKADTEYDLAVRAVNADGTSEWTHQTFRTQPDPLRYAVRELTATTSCANQGGQGIAHMTDFDEGSIWHTAWNATAVPFDIEIDLHTVNQLDELHYLPRGDAGNGTITKGTIQYSMNRQQWSDPVSFEWTADPSTKIVSLSEHPTARYLRIHVEEARGGYGSGRQFYVFRVADSEYYIPGDINHDNRLDENDLTSYMNYTGLRSGDGDFEGYVSGGDINQNGLIDAFDISHVAIELEDGIGQTDVAPVAGSVTVTADKSFVAAGDIVTVTVRGAGLRSVNALSFALPYDANLLEYAGTDAPALQQMRNLTYDRLHTNGQKALYPTFVNCGDKPAIEGDATLMTIRFRAKQRARINLQARDGMLVDKTLNIVQF
ncbi:MAG: discoidin domain-containing protein [Bacteroidaceae bacterium]|nr:discoidin domain-containing protein [Bacteroidaceae bacterium]